MYLDLFIVTDNKFLQKTLKSQTVKSTKNRFSIYQVKWESIQKGKQLYT